MYRGKKILAVIPARGGSKGIKLKNLIKIKKKTLIEHLADIIKKTNEIDYAIVSTDNYKIRKNALNTKILHVLKRPKYLSGDRISDYQVLNHAINAPNIKNKFDIILMLQPTSVLRKPHHLKKAIRIFYNKKLDSLWSVTKVDSKYHPEKQLIIKKNKLNFFSKNGKKIIARQQLNETYIRNGAIYIFKGDYFKKNKIILNKNTGIYEIKEPMISIDTHSDIKIINKII